MGWKSTIKITRNEARKLIIEKLVSLDNLTNQELESILYQLGYGDDNNLPYYGYNFDVVYELEE